MATDDINLLDENTALTVQEIPDVLTKKGRPTIVVLVESDEVLREHIKRFLAEQRCSVFAEKDTESALWYFNHFAGPIDLLIADVRLPSKKGLVFVDSVKDISGDTRVLLMGHIGTERGQAEAVRKVDVPFLPKPFTDAELLAAIKEGMSLALLKFSGGPGSRLRNHL